MADTGRRKVFRMMHTPEDQHNREAKQGINSHSVKDLINAKTVSINFFLWEKGKIMSHLIFYVVYSVHFTGRIHLEIKKKLIAQLLLLIFPEETLSSHFKPKN